MNTRFLQLIVSVLISLAAASLSAAEASVPAARAVNAKRPIEIADLFRFHRLSAPQVSPDGRNVVYVVTDTVMEENASQSDLWLVPLQGGATPRQLTSTPKSESHPRWSPDGRWIAFEAERDGLSQIWLLPTGGGEARKLTTLSTGASEPVWSADGRSIAFVSSVFPEFSQLPFKESDRLNHEKLEAREKSKVKARIYTTLLYRHWNAWADGTRTHLFVVPVSAEGSAAGEPRDVTPGDNDALPTLASGDEFAFSPDGKELAFTAPPLPLREQAWSTNQDIWSVDLNSGQRRQLTTNPAADGSPRFSPDGRWLAYRAQRKPGFESDRWELMLMDRATGVTRSLTAAFDHWVDGLVWSPDSTRLYFSEEERGTAPVWSVGLDGSSPVRLVASGINGDVFPSPDGRTLVFTQNNETHPTEIMRMSSDGSAIQPLTQANAALLSELDLPVSESVTVSGAGGTPVQMWITRPPNFDPAKKYPLVFWVHGGPQGAEVDGWHYRWNSALWAAQGYVLARPNARGSTGFGQAFTDEISRDLGGKVFEDLMACVSYLERQPYVDATRMAAAGASYGGYMMCWFQGHTDKFKTLVTHCCLYNLNSAYAGTDELWWPEHDIGIPWETPDFEKFSPHRFAANFKTPNLVIANELDFRCPINEGLQLYTTLQRKGVPSKLLVFPDEGHWVLKPQNSVLWHQTVFDWLADYLKK